MTLVLSLGLAGGGTLPASIEFQEGPPEPAPLVYGLERCPLTGDEAEFAPLLGVLLPAALSTAFSWISGAIRKAGDKQEEIMVAKERRYLYRRNGARLEPREVGCVVLLRGVEVESGATPSANTPDGRKLARLANAGIHLGGYPEFYYEARVEPSTDNTAFRLISSYLEMRKTQDNETRPGKTRGLAIAAEVKGPAAEADGTVLASAIMNLGEVEIGKVYCSKRGGFGCEDSSSFKPEAESGWIAAIAASKATVEAFNDPKNVDVEEFMPVTLTAAATETRNGKAIFRFIAEVLGEAKQDLAKEITKEVLPQQTSDELRSAVQEARLKVLKAQADKEKSCASGQTGCNQYFDALIAAEKGACVKAALMAGVAVPADCQ